MAHHHRAPEQSQPKDHTDFQVQSTPPAVQSEPRPSKEVIKQRQTALATSKAKSWLDFEIAGLPWQFVLIAAVIALGVLGLILKTFGVY